MTPDFKNILFCTDFSDGAAQAFQYALKAAINNKARLYILHILPEADAQFWHGYIAMENGAPEDNVRIVLDGQMKQYLEQIPADVQCEASYRPGGEANQIANFCREKDISLVVIGRPKPRLLEGLLFESTTSRIVKAVPCPILIAPAD